MGNNKFKLSDMIPNAWFYKLKHMTTKSTTKRRNDKTTTKNYINQHHRQSLTNNNKPSLSPITIAITANSGHGKLAAADPPRRSSKRRSTSSSSSSRRRKPAFKPRSRLISNSSSAETFSSESDSLFAASDDDRENPTVRLSSSTADIIIDLETHHHHKNTKSFRISQRSDGIVDLPPILTKPINFDDTVFEAAKLKSNLSVKTAKEAKTLDRTKTSQNGRRSTSSSSAGIKLRSNSPRLACARKSVSYSRERRYLAESLAVVKSSVDPQMDFRESMMEMIVENNIRASKDLEELLACYLSLNSKQYHDVIVKAFERIWFDMAHTRIH